MILSLVRGCTFSSLRSLVVLCVYLSVLPVVVVSLATSRPELPRTSRPELPLNSFAHCSALAAGVRIAACGKKGLGAFAKSPILSGAYVGAYVGEILTAKEVEARYWNKRKRNTMDRRWVKSRSKRCQGLSGDYLFDMGDNLYIDGEDADVSSWCRFMNHKSKNAPTCNVETRCTRMTKDGNKIVVPTLWFVALRDIQIGEELSYDYGDSYWD
jgi:SET domain-containing protein